MAEKTSRRVRLYSKYQERSRHFTGHDYLRVPWLTLSGLWLRQAGFETGDQVVIEVSRGQLIIKNVSTDGDHRD